MAAASVVFNYDFDLPLQEELITSAKMQWYASFFQNAKQMTMASTGEVAMKNTSEFSCFIMQEHRHEELVIMYQPPIYNMNKITSTKDKICVFINSAFRSPSEQNHP